MERKPFEVETTEDHKPYSDGGGSNLTSTVDSSGDEQKKLVYRGWKVMPYIIGNAFLSLSRPLFLNSVFFLSTNSVSSCNRTLFPVMVFLSFNNLFIFILSRWLDCVSILDNLPGVVYRKKCYVVFFSNVFKCP